MSVNAVILCGGQGTRLLPAIGNSIPKCLAPFNSKPFLSYVINHLVSHGVKKVILCCRQKDHDLFFNTFYDWITVTIQLSVEDNSLGTGGALKQAFPLIDSDPVLVMNGDTYCSFDLPLFLRLHKCLSKGASVLNAYPWLSDSGRTSAGVYLFSREWIQSIPSGVVSLEDILLLDSSVWEHKWERDLLFHDIGTPERYEKTEEFLRHEGVIV